MKTAREKVEKILAIADPNQAYKMLSTDEEIPLDEAEEILELYQQKHGVTLTEMAFYPNGEKVLTEEMFL